MSSILRALKKLENQSSDAKEATSAAGAIDTKKAVNKRVKGFWLTNRITTVSLTVVILLVLGGLVFTQRNFFYGETRTSVPQPAPEKEVKKVPVKAPVMTAPAVSRSAEGETRPGDLPESSSPERVSMTIRAEKPPQEKTLPPLPEEDKIPGSDAPRAVALLPSEGKPREPLPEKKPSVAEKALDTSGFKLEAIVWAMDPESRFAVINGQIVRAGGTLRGMSIKEIGRNHVALESDGREGRLKFRAE
ncbi:MAG: hypothetical protein ABII06_02200 [Pseudomonadota bacterium]